MAGGDTYNFYKGSQKVDHIDRQVNKYYYGKSDGGDGNDGSLRQKIEHVLPFIKISRHWFSVCKVLMEMKEVGQGDFEGALTLIGAAFPEGIPKCPTAKDLASLDVQSLRFAVERWDEKDSPVQKGLSAYKTVYLRFRRTYEDE